MTQGEIHAEYRRRIAAAEEAADRRAADPRWSAAEVREVRDRHVRAARTWRDVATRKAAVADAGH